jgi:hypothetical protein
LAKSPFKAWLRHVAVALGILGCLQFGRTFPGLLKTTAALPMPVKSKGTKSWATEPLQKENVARNLAVVLNFIVSRNGRGTHRFTYDSHTITHPPYLFLVFSLYGI